MTAMSSPHTAPVSQTSSSSCIFSRALSHLGCSQAGNRENAVSRTYPRLPPPSQPRLEASLDETSREVGTLSDLDFVALPEKRKTVLYLAYGSNLCNETFRDVRGIRPLSQGNVLVPSLRLTFDLPGIPYHEPCFANSALRDPSQEIVGDEDYHKDRWHKGMVGCVYEVTPEDYAHIIATEGGGASYQDILVDCYPLEDAAETVPSVPSTRAFKAHTLFAPVTSSTTLSRPDPSYAQPSARYLKLITDGATELNLPADYQAYLHDIRPYTITTRRQKMGHQMIVKIWWPIIMVFFALSKGLHDKKGRSPKWVGVVMGALFTFMWMSYDKMWIKMFGDGERTEGEDEDEDDANEWPRRSREIVYKKGAYEGKEWPSRGEEEQDSLV